MLQQPAVQFQTEASSASALGNYTTFRVATFRGQAYLYMRQGAQGLGGHRHPSENRAGLTCRVMRSGCDGGTHRYHWWWTVVIADESYRGRGHPHLVNGDKQLAYQWMQLRALV